MIPDPDAVRRVRSGAGLARESLFGSLLVSGPDALSFLDSQLPAAIPRVDEGAGGVTARLDRLGRVHTLFAYTRDGDAMVLLPLRERVGFLAEDLDRFHIREDLAFDSGAGVSVLELHGPETSAVLHRLTGVRPRTGTGDLTRCEVAGIPVRFVFHAWTGSPGGHVLVESAQANDVVRAIAGDSAVTELTPEDLEVLRIEGGWPLPGRDLDEKTLILELDRDDELVAFDKGCYLGQETVARVHSRGRVQKLLRGLVFEGEQIPPPGTLLFSGDDPAGETRSGVHSPALDSTVVLAWVSRRFADDDEVLHAKLGANWVPARVVRLPLYRTPGPAEQARVFYRSGNEAFGAGEFDTALGWYEKAVLMNPGFVDAYEALGICHERAGRLTEATEVMEELATMDPGHAMAWTNLSRYYARDGRIAEAETAQVRANALIARQRQGDEDAAKLQAETQAEDQKRKEERIAIFRQVLELDPDDVVANFGLGKLLLDLGRPAEAILLFAKSVEGKPDYSMAYNLWGESLAGAGRTDEAADVWRRGIEVAGSQGDLMPKRAMTGRLAELGSD